MFKKQQRLSRLAFGKVFSSGKRKDGPNTTLIVKEAEAFGCSVVVSKKVAKKAHDRNRLRRRIYALVREVVGVTPPLLALIIITKPAIGKLTKAKLREVLLAEVGRGLNYR